MQFNDVYVYISRREASKRTRKTSEIDITIKITDILFNAHLPHSDGFIIITLDYFAWLEVLMLSETIGEHEANYWIRESASAATHENSFANKHLLENS